MSTTWLASPSCASCWAVSSMAEKQNTPEIRFEGFTDPWEQRKLGDCFEFLKSNTLSRAGLNGENGTARNVHYGDILIKFGDCLDGERSDLPFITDDTVLPKFAGSILREGDVIFADTAEDEAAGKCVELRKLPKEPTISGLHTIPARPRFPFGTGYLGHYLNSDAYHRQLLPLMQGIKVISVSKAALQDTQVRFPGLSEQTAIGAALSEVDALITLHQRKHDKLCTMKRSMLDKMFPKPGETEPEIRFKGFTDPWEQRKLGELGFAQSGIGFPDAEQGGTEGTPFFKVSDMNTPGNEYELVASNNYVTAEQIARMGWRPINQVPAIFFAKVGAAVMLNRKRLVNEPFLLDNNTMAFSMDSSLLDTQFGRSLFERLDLTSLIQVGALPSFNSSDVESISVSLPSTMNEQRQIGQYLYDLNTLITLHQRKLDLLKNTKKSLLDKMFV